MYTRVCRQFWENFSAVPLIIYWQFSWGKYFKFTDTNTFLNTFFTVHYYYNCVYLYMWIHIYMYMHMHMQVHIVLKRWQGNVSDCKPSCIEFFSVCVQVRSVLSTHMVRHEGSCISSLHSALNAAWQSQGLAFLLSCYSFQFLIAIL